MIGTFGNIVFETSSSKIRTFEEFKRKGSAMFSEHPVLEGKPKLQHLGTSLDEISFSITFNVALGIDPREEINKLQEIKNIGDEKKLIIGRDVLGSFVLTELSESWDKIDSRGNLLLARVDLSLKEFVNGN